MNSRIMPLLALMSTSLLIFSSENPLFLASYRRTPTPTPLRDKNHDPVQLLPAPIIPAASRRPKIQRGSHKQGGVIIFVHLPKTGGASIQRNMKGQPHNDYFFSVGNWRGALQRMNATLYSPQEKVFWLEQHTMVPYFLSTVLTMSRWRKIAAQRGVPFFAFTLLRDPVDWAISSFGHACIRKKLCGDTPNTEDGLLRKAIPNPQCSFFVSGYHNLKRKWDPSEEQCNQVYQAFLQDMDWVGTLERYNETQYVLQEVLGRDILSNWVVHNNASAIEEANLKDKRLRRSNLAPRSVEYLERISWLDRELYNKVQATFSSPSAIFE